MNLTIILTGKDPMFHVHAAGCADTSRAQYRACEQWTDEHGSRLGLAWHTYAGQIADEFDSDDDLERHGAAVAAEYLGDFRFFPCCADLPANPPTINPDKENA